MYPQSMFSAKVRKNVTFLHLKIAFFFHFKKLHGHVFVMVPLERVLVCFEIQNCANLEDDRVPEISKCSSK